MLFGKTCWGPGRILQDGFQKYTVGNHVNHLGIHCNHESGDGECETKEMRHCVRSAGARDQVSGSVRLGSWLSLCKGGLEC